MTLYGIYSFLNNSRLEEICVFVTKLYNSPVYSGHLVNNGHLAISQG